MATKKQGNEETPESPIEGKADAIPLIMPVSQLNQLSEKEKQAFRDAGGTATEG